MRPEPSPPPGSKNYRRSSNLLAGKLLRVPHPSRKRRVGSIFWRMSAKLLKHSRQRKLDCLRRHALRFRHAPFSNTQADPAAHWPRQQPGQPVPVRPSLAPVRDRHRDSHHLTDDEEPQHMKRGPPRSEPCTQPCAHNRDHDEQTRARSQRHGRRNSAAHEIPRKHTTEQRIRAQNKNDRKNIGPHNGENRSQHR